MPKTNASTEKPKDKLDQIIEILQRMDKRDRARTIGGLFKGLLGLIPLFIMLYAAWYFYAHFDDILMKITKQAAEQAATLTQEGGNNLMKQFEGMFQLK